MTEQRKLTAIGSQEIQSFVQQWFKNQLKTDKFSVVIENGSKKGDNFIGTVYRAVATKFNGTTEEEWSDEGEKQYSIIVKVASQKYARRQYFHLRSCFLQEIYMYDKVVKYSNPVRNSLKFNQSLNRTCRCYQHFISSKVPKILQCKAIIFMSIPRALVL